MFSYTTPSLGGKDLRDPTISIGSAVHFSVACHGTFPVGRFILNSHLPLLLYMGGGDCTSCGPVLLDCFTISGFSGHFRTAYPCVKSHCRLDGFISLRVRHIVGMLERLKFHLCGGCVWLSDLV